MPPGRIAPRVSSGTSIPASLAVHGTRRRAIRPEDIAQAIAAAALEKKARDVAILDMSNLVDYTDLFVLCSATNRRQVQAIADEVRRVAKQELGLPTVGVEGYEAARWVLVDFGSVVLHVFEEPMRGFYNLDALWRDAPRLPVPDAGAEADSDDVEEIGPGYAHWP